MLDIIEKYFDKSLPYIIEVENLCTTAIGPIKIIDLEKTTLPVYEEGGEIIAIHDSNKDLCAEIKSGVSNVKVRELMGLLREIGMSAGLVAMEYKSKNAHPLPRLTIIVRDDNGNSVTKPFQLYSYKPNDNFYFSNFRQSIADNCTLELNYLPAKETVIIYLFPYVDFNKSENDFAKLQAQHEVVQRMKMLFYTGFTTIDGQYIIDPTNNSEMVISVTECMALSFDEFNTLLNTRKHPSYKQELVSTNETIQQNEKN